MSVSHNHCTVMGNLTRDLELRYTPSGTAVAQVGIAVNERRKKGEEWVDVVHFFDVTMFGKLAERCTQHLKKGDTALVSGRLQMDTWEDKSGGGKRTKVFVLADDVVFVKWGKDRQHGDAPGADAGSCEAPPF